MNNNACYTDASTSLSHRHTQHPVVKAAVYTRKSSEEGLELRRSNRTSCAERHLQHPVSEYNSLDAQRDACRAYIQSQKHEGWIWVDKEYSDGGVSGGTLNRPALQELLKDIGAGLVDIIVVYKIDRLTRSLHDFSKLVEVFDKYNTSFVSITQQFNTSTSMGRLTLNMLLSFAQFEREVSGERIRDKKRAMAVKGMWGNGLPPLGYAKKEKRLVPHPAESKLVNHIYEKYLELGNVRQLTEYLAKEGYTSQRGKSLSAGNLYKILSRKVYIGKIEHREEVYEGRHEAILPEELFNRVQKQLTDNNHAHKMGIRQKISSLLGGILYDDAGHRMGPTHSQVTPRMGELREGQGCPRAERRRKYRYYQSIPVTRGKKHLAGTVAQVGAGEVEEFVIRLLKKELENETYQESISIEERQYLQGVLAEKLTKLKMDKILVKSLIKKAVLSKDHMKLFLNKGAVVELLHRMIRDEGLENLPQGQEIVEKEYPCKMTAVRNGAKMIVGEGQGVNNATLKEALKKSMEYHGYLLSGKYSSAREIAEQVENNKDERYVYHILNLRFLAGDILEDILTDKLSDYYTVKEMSKCGGIASWKEQRIYLKGLRK